MFNLAHATRPSVNAEIKSAADEESYTACTRREVIINAEKLQSPQLLELSESNNLAFQKANVLIYFLQILT